MRYDFLIETYETERIKVKAPSSCETHDLCRSAAKFDQICARNGANRPDLEGELRPQASRFLHDGSEAGAGRFRSPAKPDSNSLGSWIRVPEHVVSQITGSPSRGFI
jgi:hypothetical protein